MFMSERVCLLQMFIAGRIGRVADTVRNHPPECPGDTGSWTCCSRDIFCPRAFLLPDVFREIMNKKRWASFTPRSAADMIGDHVLWQVLNFDPAPYAFLCKPAVCSLALRKQRGLA